MRICWAKIKYTHNNIKRKRNSFILLPKACKIFNWQCKKGQQIRKACPYIFFFFLHSFSSWDAHLFFYKMMSFHFIFMYRRETLLTSPCFVSNPYTFIRNHVFYAWREIEYKKKKNVPFHFVGNQSTRSPFHLPGITNYFFFHKFFQTKPLCCCSKLRCYSIQKWHVCSCLRSHVFYYFQFNASQSSVYLNLTN